jgi:hypothetical protein
MLRPLLIACLLVAATPAAADTLTALGSGWSRYVNTRFGTSLDIPTDLLLPEEPPENGDGRRFRGEDGARLEVFGTYGPSAIMQPFAAYKDDLLARAEQDGLTVTYTRGGDTWLAFSGTKGEDIVYAKVLESCGAAHEFRIVYPAARKQFYDPIVTRLERSLRCRSSR